jgi:hypothetical protein
MIQLDIIGLADCVQINAVTRWYPARWPLVTPLLAELPN